MESAKAGAVPSSAEACNLRALGSFKHIWVKKNLKRKIKSISPKAMYHDHNIFLVLLNKIPASTDPSSGRSDVQAHGTAFIILWLQMPKSLSSYNCELTFQNHYFALYFKPNLLHDATKLLCSLVKIKIILKSLQKYSLAFIFFFPSWLDLSCLFSWFGFFFFSIASKL